LPSPPQRFRPQFLAAFSAWLTVHLASVLFPAGISGHFRVRAARAGLVTIGGITLTLSAVLLILAPGAPVTKERRRDMETCLMSLACLRWPIRPR
jgi:hypothetical protein